MDTGSFRARLGLRKATGHDATRKGPIMAKNPVPGATVLSPSHQSREVRSPMGPGPPPLATHRRRRGGSPDPRAKRPDSPKLSPRSSPRTSPVRQPQAECSSNPFRYRTSRCARPVITLPVRSTVNQKAPIRSKPRTSRPLVTPTSPTTKKLASPTSGWRPPSPARRPASPRGTSPGSRVPAISEEALKARVSRALKARLYLLHQLGPNSFTVGGDSPSHKYKVIVGPQTCSCGHGPYCVHVLFVMLRVLQVQEGDPMLMAGTLKDFEVEQLLRAYEERRKKAVGGRERGTIALGDHFPLSEGVSFEKGGRSCPSSPVGPSPSHQESSLSDDDPQCPICLMCMVEGESLVTCEQGCRNMLHEHCMDVWAADRDAQGETLLCPLCRTPWKVKSSSRATISKHSRLRSPPMPKVNRSSPRTSSYMSSSFAGRSGTLSVSSPSSRTMSRSVNSAHSSQDSAYASPGISSAFIPGMILGCSYPPTVRGEISAAIVEQVSEEAVPLPRSEPIPEEHERTAEMWIRVFGRELVSCLFSRDWPVRETGLRRLAHEIVKALHWDNLITGEQRQRELIHCCANILAQVANDPVYKVYLACLRCLRVLLSYLSPSSNSEMLALQDLFKPLLHTLLLKCADGNRRTSQISIDSLVELSRSQSGELALGTRVSGTNLGLGGIEYVLSIILNECPPSEGPWQWLLGRLCVLDRLMEEFPSEFCLKLISIHMYESGYKLENYDRLMTVVEFAFKALGSSHTTVSKLARRVFICGARLAASEPAVFHQVCDMLSKLDVSLQARLKRRLKAQQGDKKVSLSRLGEKLSGLTVENKPTSSNAFGRSSFNSPSHLFGSKPPSLSKSPVCDKQLKKIDVPKKEQKVLAPKRPNYLPLDSIETKFKEKQAKIRMQQKTKPKVEGPVIAQHVLVPPSAKNQDSNLGKTMKSSQIGSAALPALGIPPRAIPCAKEELGKSKISISIPINDNDCATRDRNANSESMEELNKLLDNLLPFVPRLDALPSSNATSSAHLMEENVDEVQYIEGQDWVRGPLLGTGAFSSCFQARDVQSGTLMAVKQVSFFRNSEEEQDRVEAQVEEEILLMMRLNHPNIVHLLGATWQSTSAFMFTEWMAGGSVACMLERYGPFYEQVILNYTKQILCGLAYLHDNMILHRDLKGANLLIDGSGQRLCIGDFGTAARLASKATITGEFQGQLLGTIAFMAPEVLRGDDYGRACDVWSVGCCVIEMATTRPPWEADNVSNQYKLMFRIAKSTNPPHVPDTLSAATQSLALSCLKLQSEERPSARNLLKHMAFDSRPP